MQYESLLRSCTLKFRRDQELKLLIAPSILEYFAVSKASGLCASLVVGYESSVAASKARGHGPSHRRLRVRCTMLAGGLDMNCAVRYDKDVPRNIYIYIYIYIYRCMHVHMYM